MTWQISLDLRLTSIEITMPSGVCMCAGRGIWAQGLWNMHCSCHIVLVKRLETYRRRKRKFLKKISTIRTSSGKPNQRKWGLRSFGGSGPNQVRTIPRKPVAEKTSHIKGALVVNLQVALSRHTKESGLQCTSLLRLASYLASVQSRQKWDWTH